MSEFAHCAGVGPAGSIDGVTCGSSVLQSLTLLVRFFSLSIYAGGMMQTMILSIDLEMMLNY